MRRKISPIAATMLMLVANSAAFAEPPASGTISVEPAAAEPAFVEAVGNALARKAFTLLSDAGHSRFVANVKISRAEAGTSTAKVPVKGAAAEPGTSSASVGGSVNVTLPTAKTRTGPLQQIRLEIQIRQQGKPEVLWHGTAMTVRAPDALDGKDSVVARDLSEALFRTYPVQSESVVSVP